MPVPSIIHASLPLRKLIGPALLGVALLFVTKPAPGKGPAPAARILLEPLGYQPPQTQFLLAGGSMMTLDFVDNSHLLLTYSSKRLLKRLSDCPAADQDRVIDAVLLQLPDGKPLARTSWRVHDRGQYLWNLGQGRFLLRNRDTLTTIAPMVNHAKGEAFGGAFKERPFIETKRRIGGVLLSPDADLLILETLEPLPTGGLEEATTAPSPASSGSDNDPAARPVQINLFRLALERGDEIHITPGAATRSRTPGRIPANSAGYISILDQGQQHWAFDFMTFGGKKTELAPFDSTCRPSPSLVSRGEFIAFGCHLSHTPQVLGGFNMRGEEMWEQNLPESYIAPSFSYSPASGRFAFSRVLTHTSLVTDDLIVPELIAGQSIIVYQTSTGRQLLHVDAAPVARAGQNFALSPDGLSLAVIRTDAVEVYSLPPLTAKEREAIKLAEAAAPRPEEAPSSLALTQAAQDTPTEASGIAPPEPKAPAAADALAASSQTSNTSATNEGQGNEEQTPRKPPTLYNEPGERPSGHSGTSVSKQQPQN